ncbi:hypothetical protein LEP1GSC036_0206 [Leptospira weilii str. 2006001853]|uniref:Uncharacterized protein n=2 Tax=Leptospira weilii TaxID=28184 RepID=A0A828Z7F8_9LEPT|nr:hypothetical protein LEP1GSC036_0206 [Leptospira weilii str. 2006001853]EMM74058.1 hypothetical protein LEP1GSC038_0073 [Leptospira weilii str. 2006001855]EMN44311.1 hypothetical protein LEP1GSC086_0945 [Leptospira weilii str. LNT 1234]
MQGFTSIQRDWASLGAYCGILDSLFLFLIETSSTFDDSFLNPNEDCYAILNNLYYFVFFSGNMDRFQITTSQ